jgi:hypothetical protein
MRFYAIAPLLFMLAGIALSRSGVVAAMYGWGLVALGALLGLAVSVTIYFRRVRKGQPHFRVFAIIPPLPLAVVVPIVIHDLSDPRINDVATDVANPLAFAVALSAPANAGRDMAFPEDFGPIVREAYASSMISSSAFQIKTAGPVLICDRSRAKVSSTPAPTRNGFGPFSPNSHELCSPHP